MKWMKFVLLAVCGILFLTDLCREVAAAEKNVIKLAEGHLSLQVPKGWIRKEPRVRIIDAEYAIPALKGDKIDGRLTVMGAGGSIQQNIDRWMGQFSQPDGKSTKDRTQVTKQVIAGQEVHFVDITGTFRDQRGPFAPATSRENYRMLSAIVVTPKLGQYFVKLYGPRKTIAANEKKFKEMINSLKVN